MGSRKADTLSRELAEAAKHLSQDRLKVLVELAKLLEAGEAWEATAEVLEDPSVAEQLRTVRRDLRDGNDEAFLAHADMMERVRAKTPSAGGAPVTASARQRAHSAQ